MDIQSRTLNEIPPEELVAYEQRRNSIIAGTMGSHAADAITHGNVESAVEGADAVAAGAICESVTEVAGTVAAETICEAAAEVAGTVAAEKICEAVAEVASGSIGEIIGEAIGNIIGGILDGL